MITAPSPRLGLADVWPEVGTRLTAILRRRVDRTTAEDIVQETALRAVRDQVPFSSADDLLRWASCVGIRLAIDSKRRRRFIDPAPVPDRAGPHNVAATVDHRLTLDAVATALDRLSSADRAAILAPPAGRLGGTRRESVRHNVARHRARVKLRTLMEGLVVVVGWLLRRSRASLPIQAALAAAVIVPGVWFAALRGSASPHPGPSSRVAGWSMPAARTSTGTIPKMSRSEPVRPDVAGPQQPPKGSSSRDPTLLGRQVQPTAISGTTPGGHAVDMGVRPDKADDHLACVSVAGATLKCVDSPSGIPSLK